MRKETPASSARSNINCASCPLVRKTALSGTPASCRRPRSSAHTWGRYNSRSSNALPLAPAWARNTPTWQFSIRPAVPLYCRCTPTDLSPFLRNPVLVYHQNSVGIAQMLHHVVPEVITNQVRVPPVVVKQALHSVGCTVASLFGQLPAVLALHRTEQPSQIGQSPSARLGPPEPGGDALMRPFYAIGPQDHFRRLVSCNKHHRTSSTKNWLNSSSKESISSMEVISTSE